ncbi:hypothetical protein NPIL_497181 [Nephila pilipes]|uniref:Uncharacterized protein n=1 Tax=Nephila pilipes TaxID=299642 RepID=A0A8X6KIR8_NEPPI|nr:hypothetical protein NPIL_497181 [Nephila pilipes]
MCFCKKHQSARPCRGRSNTCALRECHTNPPVGKTSTTGVSYVGDIKTSHLVPFVMWQCWKKGHSTLPIRMTTHRSHFHLALGIRCDDLERETVRDPHYINLVRVKLQNTFVGEIIRITLRR